MGTQATRETVSTAAELHYNPNPDPPRSHVVRIAINPDRQQPRALDSRATTRAKLGSFYTPQFENTAHYSKPLFSREQTQGAIDLSQVRYSYEARPNCGPEISRCQSHHITGSEAPGSAWEYLDDQAKIRLQPQASASPITREAEVSWSKDAQLRFMRPRGIEVNPDPSGREPTFSGIIFSNEPDNEPKIFLINPRKTFDWIKYLMYTKERDGRETFWPENLLSVEGLLSKAETSCINDCHYFMIHEPALTKRDGAQAVHDCRVWTEASRANCQAFVCSGGLSRHANLQ